MTFQYKIPLPLPPSSKTPSNYISTTKYNAISFVPVALIIQFKRYANIYFLICAVLQSIPLISPLNPLSAIAPLILVLALSMLRQGYEDYKRWKSDKKDNSEKTRLFSKDKLQEIQWRSIKMGDFVKIEKDQIIPADLLIVLSSQASGIAYVQTASLDGQKNLKPKFSLAPLQRNYNQKTNLPSFDSIKGQIRCINPTAQVQSFQGQINLTLGTSIITQRINKKNMILRGCRLKNTSWAIGIAVYIGKDTAIMMNSSQPFTKTSNIQVKVNNTILLILIFQILCCLISAGYSYYNCGIQSDFQALLQYDEAYNCLQYSGITFASYFILYSTFIPISLIVSLEVVKFFQGFLMSRDKEMYCLQNNRRLQCRTVSINQQLGQIDYILTDKTGTLTCNKMQFKNIIIGQQTYGSQIQKRKIAQNFDYQRLSQRYNNVPQQRHSFDPNRLTYDLVIQGEDNNRTQQTYTQKQLIELAFFMICTCHQCVPTQDSFQGSSPDQVSLLKAAKEVGFTFLSCHNKIISVSFNQKVYTFELLKLVEFDSNRKRMSIVIRTQQGISVFVKGADTSIMKLLSPKQRYLSTIQNKTEEMSKIGLRTLWFAYKTYPSTTNVSQLTVQQIENDLTLVSATGIQDRLQDFVAQTIYSLRSGGIKFVMLTGDKLQTAENIAISCKLIQQGYLIKDKQALQTFYKQIEQLGQVKNSPVIDGSSLSFKQNKQKLQLIINKCKSVVFSRVTPGQKAQIVSFVKGMGKLTLAIGDGANDVNMIMQANVGVGIFGQQGTRAAQVANYAIGQFCLLWKLVLYYGRINYMRVTQLILYFFYKNMVFTIIQFVYSFYTMGSGQSFWLSWSITFYNMIFTFFPVVLRAILQVDLQITSDKQTFSQLSQGTHQMQTFYSYYPKLYNISQKNKLFTPLIFLSWFVLGIFQGTACLIITLYALGDDQGSGQDSYDIGLYLIQICVYTSVIIVVTIKLAVNTKHWTLLQLLGILIPSIGLYIVYTFISQFLDIQVSYDSMVNLLSMPIFYVIQFLCIGGMLCIDFFLFSFKATKSTFQNYLKFKTLKKQKLQESNLRQMMLEMSDMSGRSTVAPENKK